ncbi:hypothetical protein BHE74_00037182 [Ensete ventricosum]|nr:hypothetical protein GW17_00036070 [Ensete ventricosum]RWW56130.1 hypothetical protein BHE74_00037182 [Ensete ventricosum]RZS05168.1 hypothetical protein BHM03_00035633 [Ensete ventricosum]
MFSNDLSSMRMEPLAVSSMNDGLTTAKVMRQAAGLPPTMLPRNSSSPQMIHIAADRHPAIWAALQNPAADEQLFATSMEYISCSGAALTFGPLGQSCRRAVAHQRAAETEQGSTWALRAVRRPSMAAASNRPADKHADLEEGKEQLMLERKCHRARCISATRS